MATGVIGNWEGSKTKIPDTFQGSQRIYLHELTKEYMEEKKPSHQKQVSLNVKIDLS